MAGFAYRYELRRGDEVIATGRMTHARAVEVGERITLSGRLGVVRSIEPVLGERDLHMVVQLFRDQISRSPQRMLVVLAAWAMSQLVESRPALEVVQLRGYTIPTPLTSGLGAVRGAIRCDPL